MKSSRGPNAPAGTCGLCGAASLRIYIDGMYAFGKKRYDLVRCPACGNVQVSPMPRDAEIVRLYQDPDYFKTDYDSGVTSGAYTENSRSILERHRYVTDFLRKHHPAPGVFLEIGCAEGTFLDSMRRSGWRVQGVEISRPAAREARKKGLTIHNKSLESCRFAPRTFDAIHLGDVFEHVPRPQAYLAELQRILKPGGILILKSPKFLNSWAFRWAYALAGALRKVSPGKSRLLALMKIPWHQAKPGRPYHLYEYSEATLRTLLERQGFEVLDLKNEVIHITFTDQLAKGAPAVVLRWLFKCLRSLSVLFRLPFGSVVAFARRRPGA